MQFSIAVLGVLAMQKVCAAATAIPSMGDLKATATTLWENLPFKITDYNTGNDIEMDDTTERIGQKYYEPKVKTAIDALEHIYDQIISRLDLKSINDTPQPEDEVSLSNKAQRDWDAIQLPLKDTPNARQLQLAEIEKKYILREWKYIKELKSDKKRNEVFAELRGSEYLWVKQSLDSDLHAAVSSFDSLAIVSSPTENRRVYFQLCYLKVEVLSRLAVVLHRFLTSNSLWGYEWPIEQILKIFRFVEEMGAINERWYSLFMDSENPLHVMPSTMLESKSLDETFHMLINLQSILNGPICDTSDEG